MKTYLKLKTLRSTVFGHSTLLALLDGYKNPNEKIKSMVKNGDLIRIKKELYVVGDTWREEEISLELIANTLYGPSYVSMEWALSFYGLIPERVYEISSITTKNAKTYDTPLGRFTYIKAKNNLFSLGIVSQSTQEGNYFLIASPEKALCDKLLYTPNLRISSQKQMRVFLEENLRIDTQMLKKFDCTLIEACITQGVKKAMLTHLLTFIKILQGAIDATPNARALQRNI